VIVRAERYFLALRWIHAHAPLDRVPPSAVPAVENFDAPAVRVAASTSSSDVYRASS